MDFWTNFHCLDHELLIAKLNTHGFLLALITCQIGNIGCNFIKKKTLAQVFSCELLVVFKNTYFLKHRLKATEYC